MKFPDWQREKWTDPEGNPCIGYFENAEAGYAIGDPQLIQPGEFDDKWHVFYHGFFKDGKPMYTHLVSPDGLKWSLCRRWDWQYDPCYLFRDDDEWILYYTAIFSGEERDSYRCQMIIRAKRSRDLENWYGDTDILIPTESWERDHVMQKNPNERVQARNPCVVKLGEKHYRLYYSAGTVILPDCGYEEPKYIGCADAESPMGPFKKLPGPMLAPTDDIPYRNFACGAIKVFGTPDGLVAMYNAISHRPDGHTSSQLCVLASDDGYNWTEAPYNPIILPTDDGGWKSALVYQLDLAKLPNGNLRCYYNARDGYREGIERIGYSELKSDVSGVYRLR